MDLDLAGIPRADRDDARKAVADFLVEQILSDCDNGVSSVTGRRWAGLSADYKDAKKAESSSAKPNLELTGALLDSLEARTKNGKIQIGFFDKDQVPKADGHNNFSGDSKLPLRQSIPKPGENFRAGILDEVSRILDGFRVDDAD